MQSNTRQLPQSAFQGSNDMSQMTLDGTEPPITHDPDYPALIRELAEILEQQLRQAGIEPAHAAATSEAAAEYVREHFGGQPLYWAKGESMRQRRARERMWAEFTGNNHAELARKHGICLQQVYRRLKISQTEELARRQGRLDLGEPPDQAA